MLQHFRDMIINKLVPLGGFAGRLHENLQTTLQYMDIIRKEAVEISSALAEEAERRIVKDASDSPLYLVCP